MEPAETCLSGGARVAIGIMWSVAILVGGYSERWPRNGTGRRWSTSTRRPTRASRATPWPLLATPPAGWASYGHALRADTATPVNPWPRAWPSRCCHPSPRSLAPVGAQAATPGAREVTGPLGRATRRRLADVLDTSAAALIVAVPPAWVPRIRPMMAGALSARGHQDRRRPPSDARHSDPRSRSCRTREKEETTMTTPEPTSTEPSG